MEFSYSQTENFEMEKLSSDTGYFEKPVEINRGIGSVHKQRRQLGGGKPRKGSKIGQNCQWIVLKSCQYWGGGVKNSEKLPTSFMDGPYLTRKI